MSMISSRKKLQFYLMADRMMNRGAFKPTVKTVVSDCISPDYIMRWMKAMRFTSYYSNCQLGGGKLLYYRWLRRFKKLSVKLGFSIGPDVFGYGLVIPHYGTIVVGGSNRIGNYAVLHTSTCIVDRRSNIGDGLYLSTGAIISNHVELGDSITMGANSTLNRSCNQDSVLLVGSPALVKKESEPWYVRDGERFQKRVQAIEALKCSLFKK